MNIVLIAHNLRSALNVGSLIRTADGLGIKKIYLSGITPHPKTNNDKRLPHEINKTEKQIFKTSLGAEKYVDLSFISSLNENINLLRNAGFFIIGLEQTKSSIKINNLYAPNKIAVLIGNEVEGLKTSELSLCQQVVSIPMLGKKESFNVVQASAILLFYLQFSGGAYDII